VDTTKNLEDYNELLNDLCLKYKIDKKIINEFLKYEKSKSLFKKKHKLQEKIEEFVENAIKEDENENQ